MAHDDPHTENGSRWWSGGTLRTAGLVTVPIVLVAFLAYWLGVPRLADAIVRTRLADVENRAEVDADFDRIETSAFEGVTLHDVTVRREEADEPFASVDHLRAKLNLYHLMWGDPVVGTLEIEGASARIHRAADGTTNLERILRKLRGGKTSADSDDDGGRDGPPSYLRYFGGEWPHADISDAELTFSAAPDAAPWPIARLATDRLQVVSSGMTADVDAELALEAGPGADSRWSIPSAVTLEGTVRLPLRQSTGEMTFETPLEIVGLGPYPHFRVGLETLALKEDRTVEVRGASLDLQTDGEPSSVGAADRVAVSFDHWPTGPGDISLAEVAVDRPKLVTTIDRQHGSPVHDVLHLLRAPRADHVAGRARHVARMHYLAMPRWQRPDLEDDGDATDRPGLSERIRTLVTDRFLAEALPEVVDVRDAEIHLTDHRRMGLVDPAEKLGLREGELVVRHEPTTGEVTLEAGFEAYADESDSRGSLSATIEGNFAQGTLEADADLERLDLSWTAQMLGRRMARRVKGGTLQGRLVTSRDADSGRQSFEGFVHLEDTIVHAEKIAKEPIEDLDAGYQFEGYYDPDAEMPEMQYVERKKLVDREGSDDEPAAAAGEDEAESADAGPDAGTEEQLDIPTTGAFVLTDGEAGLNGVTAEFRPAIYGIEDVDRMPTRLDFSLRLEETDVQTLFDAIPKAIRGPTAGTEMTGTFGWDFDIEVPLHNADEMEWETDPRLADFELVDLPADVDVRRLTEGFTHHIRDNTIEFERSVRIPPMRPVPASWIVEHGEITLEEIDERRREREWPLPPSQSKLGPGVSGQTPDVWTADAAESMVAPKPWKPNQPLATLDLDAVPDGRTPVEWAREQIRGARLDAPAFGDTEDAFVPSAGTAGPATGSTVDADRNAGEADDESDESNVGRWIGRDPGDADNDSDEDDREASTRRARPEADPLDPSIIVQKKGRPEVHPYGNYVYVPIHHMSKWLPRAIMTTEDNSFFEHGGFNWYAFEESIEDNLEAGAYVRGASTVSMQLVKNVFLSFDKVLARKIQEAFLVWLMEDVVDVPKARLLELYFNIIEFGPGIFGIHDASVHYFGKRPDALTLSEVLWLVGIVPDPKDYHRYYERGEISDAWYETLVTYAEIMHDRDRAEESDVERVRNNKPSFYKPGPDEPKLRPPQREDKPSLEDLTEIFQ